jgi:hypothetical protein
MDKYWNPLVPSIVGGLIAGTSAILATWFTYKHNARLAQKQHQKRINGLLLAIRYEFEVATDLYYRKAGSLLEKLEDGKPYLHYFSLSEKYFIVYPSNTEIIGQIDDKDLCRAIIETYNTANYVLEGLKVNNWYLDRRSEFKRLLGQHPSASGAYVSTNISSLERHLVEYAPGLKKGNLVLKGQKEDLFAKIDSYLACHKVKAG